MKKVKTFAEAISVLRLKPERLDFWLQDKRMTLSEKVVLKHFVLLRDNKNQEIIECLSSLNTANEFVEMYKDFILGVAYNNAGNFDQAITYQKKAHFLSLKLDCQGHKILTLFNLFVIYHNIGERQQCIFLVNEANEYEAENSLQEIHLLRMRLIGDIYLNKLTKAQEKITRLEVLKEHMDEYFRAGFIYDKIDLYLEQGKFELVQNCLNELKSIRKFYQSMNYKYMKGLLDFIVSNTPIYLYRNTFDDAPQLWWQVRVLQCLEENDISEAKVFWNKLKNVAPNVYGSAFEFKGMKTLFFWSLKKFQDEITAPPKPAAAAGASTEKESVIIGALTSAGSIRKEELYMLVYGEEISSKDDLGKLRSYMKRIRKKYELEIVYARNCYSLGTKKKAS